MAIEITGDGYRIWIPHSLDNDSHTHGNADIHVYLNDGCHFAGTLYTLENIRWLMGEYARSGECAAGRYMFDRTMVVIRDLDRDTIRAVVDELVRTNEIASAFHKCE